MPLRTLGNDRRSLGLGSGGCRAVSGLRACARRVSRRAGCRTVRVRGGRAAGRLVPTCSRRGLLAELHGRSDLHPQHQPQQCREHRQYPDDEERDVARADCQHPVRQSPVRHRRPTTRLRQLWQCRLSSAPSTELGDGTHVGDDAPAAGHTSAGAQPSRSARNGSAREAEPRRRDAQRTRRRCWAGGFGDLRRAAAHGNSL